MACLADPASADLRFVAVGNPNTGKTTLVNALSGSCLRIGNWPGTTVERVETCFPVGDRQACLVDLPGAYSLAAGTAEERLTRDELLAARPDAVVDVVDASNLERNLYLTLELAELGYPLVVALNLLDEAQARGLDLRLEVLEERLGVPVVATVAVREQGMEGLVSAALQALSGAP
jgi:ferrous iron transport protein B